MDRFIFLEKGTLNIDNSFYIKMTPHIYHEDELLKALYYSCWFPSEFKFTWEDLLIMLTNFEWINEENIFIHHQCIPHIYSKYLKIYLDILDRSSRHVFKNNKNVKYIFMEQDKSFISTIMTC